MSTNAKELLGNFIKEAEDEAKLQTELEAEWNEYESRKQEGAYDLVKRMFTNSDEVWYDITDYEKTKQSFMINRIFSIQYPVSANNMNALKANPLGIVETWRRVARAWKRTPQWVFTKAEKAEATNPLKKFSEETLRYYMTEHWCGEREMLEQYNLNGDEFLEELKYIEDYVTGNKSAIKEKKLKRMKGKNNGHN